MTKKKIKIGIIIASLITGLLVGLTVAGAMEMRRARDNITNYELTFLSPQQAIVFWKTKEPSIGYVRFGTDEGKLDQISEQTSSESNEVHAVMLENIPPEGVYLTIHHQGESAVVWPEVRQVKYDGGMVEGNQ